MMEARKHRKERVSLNDVRTYMEGYNKMKLAFRQWVQTSINMEHSD